MAGMKNVRVGPVAMAASATNILNPPTLSGGTGLAGTNTATYSIIRKIIIVNKTGADATFSLWLGATGASAAGTEVVGTATTVPARGSFVHYCAIRLDAADFLTGLASAVTTLTFQADIEIGVA